MSSACRQQACAGARQRDHRGGGGQRRLLDGARTRTWRWRTINWAYRWNTSSGASPTGSSTCAARGPGHVRRAPRAVAPTRPPPRRAAKRSPPCSPPALTTLISAAEKTERLGSTVRASGEAGGACIAAAEPPRSPSAGRTPQANPHTATAALPRRQRAVLCLQGAPLNQTLARSVAVCKQDVRSAKWVGSVLQGAKRKGRSQRFGRGGGGKAGGGERRLGAASVPAAHECVAPSRTPQGECVLLVGPGNGWCQPPLHRAPRPPTPRRSMPPRAQPVQATRQSFPIPIPDTLA